MIFIEKNTINHLKTFLFFILFGVPTCLLAEEFSYEQLYKEILANRHRTEFARQKSLQYVEKAKRENNKEELFTAYELLARFAPNDQRTKYGDSLIFVATQLKDKERIGIAYISSSEVLEDLGNFSGALDHTLTALKYFENQKDKFNLSVAKYSIGNIKNYLQDYDGAKIYLDEAVSFFRKNSDQTDDVTNEYYIYALIALIDVETKIAHYKTANQLITEGKNFTQKNKHFSIYQPYFTSAEGVNFYRQKKYQEAIPKLKEALTNYTEDFSHPDDHFYLGMSYWNIGDKENAITHLKAVENSEEQSTVFRPAIENLMNYYKEKGDEKMQLYYAEKLVALDKKINEDQQKANVAMTKKDDNPNSKKSNIIGAKYMKTVGFSIGIGLLGLLTFFLMKKRKTKENTTDTEQNETTQEPDIDYNAYKPIHPKTVKKLLKNLSDFEVKKGFTERHLKLNTLAERLGTNEKYLSKIIKTKYNKNFHDYITDLRWDYLRILKSENPNLITEKTPIELAEWLGFPDATIFEKEYEKQQDL
ncbi:MAG: hypothetical protein Q4G16_09410 [Cruoricaptor ignavus]|nr:hypothetical protein [Cruoricaptor ignavus]